jgi:DNA-binding transcriptional ArsR family regulator
MSKDVKESDWKAFRDSLVDWRERYLETTTEEIVDLLQEEGSTPTERFWQAKERIDEEAEILHECLDNYSRSKMQMHLVLLYGHGLIDESDLGRFGDDLRNRVLSWF